jgi:hypothetical protein
VRPILLGMCLGPAGGTEPLGIDVPGSAGWRLWKMSGLSRSTYLSSFKRTNLVPGKRWNARTARTTAIAFVLGLRAGDIVVALGSEVKAAIKYAGGNGVVLDARIHFVPHPSGRNLFYNDPANRRRVGRLLRRLAT